MIGQFAGAKTVTEGGWALASQRWLEVNDLGRLVNRYGRRQWHPTPVLLPGKSHGQRSLLGCSPWGRTESDTTERLHFHFHFHALEKERQPTPVFLPGESQGLGSLVGCSPWGRTESDTTEQLHFHFHFHALEKEIGRAHV